MWADEKEQLRKDVVDGIITAVCYIAVWAALMVPVMVMLLNY